MSVKYLDKVSYLNNWLSLVTIAEHPVFWLPSQPS